MQKSQPISAAPSRGEKARSSPELDLPLFVERNHPLSLQQQLAQQLRRMITQGRLEPGSTLPPSRVVARALGVTRHVVVEAYEELLLEGYLEARQGSGTRVSREALPEAAPAPSGHDLPRWLPTFPRTGVGKGQQVDFRQGAALVAALPPSAWSRAWRKATRTLPPGDYGDPQGELELRSQIAAYLRRTRGFSCSPHSILVTLGATAALQTLAEALVRKHSRVALEEPGYPLAQRIFAAQGAELVAVPVDDDGLRVGLLEHSPQAPLLVHVTPAHQYPMGGRLSIPRRKALLEWAATNDSLIVENDYDHEFRYGSAPLPALAALGQSLERVVYVGTFSKVLTPALRVGFLVAPRPLCELLVALKAGNRERVPQPVQLAVAALIESGDLERHVRRLRRLHAAQRQALLDGLGELPPGVSLRGSEAGLHLLLEFGPGSGLEAADLLAQAERAGVLVESLDRYYLAKPRRNGLILGYGGLNLDQIEQGVAVLRGLINRPANPDR